MKKSITLLALALIASPAMAGEAANCKAIADLAASIMNGRQEGVPISTMMKIAMREKPSSKLEQMLVKRAYKTNRYSTPKMKALAVLDFENDVYMTCIE